jgi:hypothetical protein
VVSFGGAYGLVESYQVVECLVEIGGVDDHAFDYFSVAVEFAPIAIEILPEAALEPGRHRIPSPHEWQVWAGKGLRHVTTTP